MVRLLGKGPYRIKRFNIMRTFPEIRKDFCMGSLKLARTPMCRRTLVGVLLR